MQYTEIPFRKDFEMRIKERDKVEAAERLQYRAQLDDKTDQRKEAKKDFYKDVSKFQVCWKN